LSTSATMTTAAIQTEFGQHTIDTALQQKAAKLLAIILIHTAPSVARTLITLIKLVMHLIEGQRQQAQLEIGVAPQAASLRPVRYEFSHRHA
jgi:hypothetical protein